MRGLRFPLQITPLGRFAVAADETKLIQNARLILGTIKRERFYEPNMGTTGYKALFRNFSPEAATTLSNVFQEALNAQEPRAVWTVTFVKQELDGRVFFRVSYKLKTQESAGTFIETFSTRE